MSNKQWGHGYWVGVNDARKKNYGTYSEKAKKCADAIILSIVDYEEQKNDRDVKSLNTVIAIFILSGFYEGEDRKTINSALNYIWREEPYGFYISGDDGYRLDYENDYLITTEI